VEDEKDEERALIEQVLEDLERDGLIVRTAWTRQGQPVYVAREFYEPELHGQPRDTGEA